MYTEFRDHDDKRQPYRSTEGIGQLMIILALAGAMILAAVYMILFGNEPEPKMQHITIPVHYEAPICTPYQQMVDSYGEQAAFNAIYKADMEQCYG